MKKVCVITGGGSGMGLATARRMVEKDYHVILVGRTAAKLDKAVAELQELGGEAETYACDVSDPKSVAALAGHAKTRGSVMVVIHAAGMSPHMGIPEQIMRINAMGTIYMNNAFVEIMDKGGCLIDTSSISAYIVPSFIIPKRLFRFALKDPDLFYAKMMRLINLFPGSTRTGVAYAFSKAFVIWFAQKDAARFGEKGMRVLSITPGNFDTPMGDAEKNEALRYVQTNAIKRLGDPDEIAALYATVSDESMGFLTGTDILCDGGCIASGAATLGHAPKDSRSACSEEQAGSAMRSVA